MFTKAQRGVLGGCFLVYTSAYIARLNLAQALWGIQESLRLTGAEAGALQTVFAITYAAGQLAVGASADRLSPRRFMLMGLMGTALINIACSFAASYPALLVLMALNGALQSMLWTPIVKTVAEWFEGAARARAGFVMSVSTIAGHLLSWLVAGWMASAFSWRMAFLAPGAIVLAIWPFCFRLVRDFAGERVAQAPGCEKPKDAMPVGRLIFSTGLWAMLVACAAQGFVRDGITTWGPSILAQSFGGGAALVSLVIPALNALGLVLGRIVFARVHGRARAAALVMMGLCAVSTAMLWLVPSPGRFAFAAMLGVSCAILYGNTPMLTAFFPMEYAGVRRVALVAGLVDCFCYLGSALAGAAIGLVYDRMGLYAVYALWAIASALGTALAGVGLKGRNPPRPVGG